MVVGPIQTCEDSSRQERINGTSIPVVGEGQIMRTYPYTKSVAALRKFMEGIPERGIPEIIDAKHLSQLGIAEGNHRSIIDVLTFIGFIDNDGRPTEKYKEVRMASKQTEVLRQSIEDAYSDLFKTYPDACRRSKEDLIEFFTPTTNAGKRTIQMTASTFIMLCELAGEGPPKRAKRTSSRRKTKPVTTGKTKPKPQQKIGIPMKEVTINVNVQLVLPETKDASVYEMIFDSLRKHLLE
ncbi:MAG: DUF5343 domain-containing protein [Candidatus Thorarchaeota archaeon]